MRLDIGCIDKPQVRNSMPQSIRKFFSTNSMELGSMVIWLAACKS